MLLEIFAAILLGVTSGIVTGLVPGIHVNLVSLLVVGIASSTRSIPLECLAAFIAGLAITHTFLDTIPSIYLGAPDSATVLSVLPGHRFLLEGKGLQAVKLTIIGSIIGLSICALTYPLLEIAVGTTYPAVQPFIGLLLVIVSAFIVGSGSNKLKSVFVFVCAGALGYAVLNSRLENPLFPLLGGFFGIASLAVSLKSNTNLPKQELSETTEFKKLPGIISGAIGTFSGFITAILPGIGASTAAAIGSLLKKESESSGFLIMIGAISTVNFFMSIAALTVLGKARNGAIVAIQAIYPEVPSILLIGACLLAAGLAVQLAIWFSRAALEIVQMINYAAVVKSVIVLLLGLTMILSGWQGLLVLGLAAAVGYYSNLENVPRNTMMACILVPVACFFLL